jgi:hypothetical protein
VWPARRVFPLGFRRQASPRPLAIIGGLLPIHPNDRVSGVCAIAAIRRARIGTELFRRSAGPRRFTALVHRIGYFGPVNPEIVQRYGVRRLLIGEHGWLADGDGQRTAVLFTQLPGITPFDQVAAHLELPSWDVDQRHLVSAARLGIAQCRGRCGRRGRRGERRGRRAGRRS